LGSGNDWQSKVIAARNQMFLNQRHFFGRHLDSQVSSSHHDSIGDVKNFIQVGNRFRLLDFHDKRECHFIEPLS